MSHDLDAAILAGGLGTRLRSVVADRPKVLAPVGGRPYLTYLLDQLADAGIERVVLLVGHRADMVRESLGTHYRGLRLLYSAEPTPLGTGGALAHALPWLAGRHVLLLNGDSFCEFDLAVMRQRPLSMAVAHVSNTARYGEVIFTDDGRVLAFGEKSEASVACQHPGKPGWINAGVYCLPREAIQSLPNSRPLSLERDAIPQWVQQQQLYAVPTGGRFIDIGTPESFAEAGAFFQTRCHVG